jgi:hypothetical protein
MHHRDHRVITYWLYNSVHGPAWTEKTSLEAPQSTVYAFPFPPNKCRERQLADAVRNINKSVGSGGFSPSTILHIFGALILYWAGILGHLWGPFTTPVVLRGIQLTFVQRFQQLYLVTHYGCDNNIGKCVHRTPSGVGAPQIYWPH